MYMEITTQDGKLTINNCTFLPTLKNSAFTLDTEQILSYTEKVNGTNFLVIEAPVMVKRIYQLKD